MNELTEKRSIETITTEFLFYKQQTGANILKMGECLIEAKEQLEHGAWLDWLEHRADTSVRTAQNLMRLSKEYGNTKSISYLGVTKALALLSVPAEERDEFAEDVGANKLSVRELKDKIREREDALRQAESERDSARRELSSWQIELKAQIERSANLQQERQNLLDKLKELENRPVDVATVDATEEQIEAAEKRGREHAQWELDTTKRQLNEQVQNVSRLQGKLEEKRRELEKLKEDSADASEDAKINQALGEINGKIREMQAAHQRVTELLGGLDEMSRIRVQTVRKNLLKRFLEDIK